MTKKEFGRCIAFLLVACVILCVLCDLFEQDNKKHYDKRFNTYRNLNRNTVDAVWIGTSGVDCYWISPKAYEEYGLTLYPLSADGLPAWLIIDMIREIYTYQNPKLIVVDVRPFTQDNTSANKMDVRARRILDAMDFFSVNRIRAAFTTMRTIHETIEGEPRFELSYLLPYIKYHTKWQEDDYLISKHWGNRDDTSLGFFMDATATILQEPLEAVKNDLDCYEDVSTAAKRSFYDLLDYARDNDIELLFVDTPQLKSGSEKGRTNAFIQLLKEEGCDYINYCETDEEGNFLNGLNLNHKTDFMNEGHVNYYGAEKFTEVFSTYLVEHYSFPDRRRDAAAQEQWDGVYDQIKATIAEWEEERALEKQ